MPEPSPDLSDQAAAALADAVAFDANGLVPAVAQQHDTGEVLMLAWMNRAAVIATLTSGRATYYSRSRAKLWRKGDTSGNVQHVREVRLDCDGDTLLLLIDQIGPACHTGRPVCFFRTAAAEGWREIDGGPA
ncbi:phosphoribosyl-AMP cyclohydrolase [Limimonas halophila]|uniref:Phosphoribosyl-AMP cyclohydrolase n=1 Tax=Limimonas halophila TaxID=1082479 RepID=A0A1G7LAS5_9PROT|nr:phosphoribosyl-AMP cyclohydrolase [Limimonas halophila]SDF46491.1 phosphoribosyl-AMP cyclohydrolase [Limimonas halophila]